MKIGVIGAGYVGLTMACLADFSNEVLFVGRSQEKIDGLKKGVMQIYEPGLDEIFVRCLKSNRIDATTDYNRLKGTEIIFLCVGTPSREDGSIDLTQIEAASKEIGKQLHDGSYKTVVVKSTVVPRTTKDVVMPILERESGKKAGRDFGVAMNPEFLREGTGIYDFLNPDKIVIGGIDSRSVETVAKLYEFYDQKIPRIYTDLNTAEMIKYANNSALAVRISFINEIANICEKVNVDVSQVAKAIGLDTRIGPRFLNAGIGFGGSCFPKDVKALLSLSKSVGIEPVLLQAVLDINKTQPYRMVELAKHTVGKLNGKKVAILGLAFKSDTDDIREASSIPVIKSLLSEGAVVKVYDPHAMESTKKIFGESIRYCQSKEDCVDGADLCLIVTEWEEFKKMDLSIVNCPIIDGRRILNPMEVEQRGLAYKGIGWKGNW